MTGNFSMKTKKFVSELSFLEINQVLLLYKKEVSINKITKELQIDEEIIQRIEYSVTVAQHLHNILIKRIW